MELTISMKNVSTQPFPKYVENRLPEHEANIITTISNIQSQYMFLQAKVEMP
jgi:tripartite-type tricarboxylate transporter receptor subunit TctC